MYYCKLPKASSESCNYPNHIVVDTWATELTAKRKTQTSKSVEKFIIISRRYQISIVFVIN